MSTGARKPARKPAIKPASVDSVCSEAVLPSRLEERPGDLPVNLSHAVLANTARLWDPGEVLTYSFLAGTENQKKKISQVIPEWALYANITFRELDEGDMFAKIRINFDENKGSWSYVGRDILRTDVTGKPTMNFGWIMDTTTLTANERGTILHEFGHTLGLMHEHQSPSRKQDLPLIESAVYDHYQWTQGWTDAQIKAQILDVYKTQTMSNYSALDTTSIMMYSMPGVVNEQGLAIPTNNQLSDTDKAWMVVNYTRPQPADDAFAKKWTLDHALDVLQVSNSDRNDILNAVNVVDRRTIFSNYLAKKRLESEGLHPLSGLSKETIGRQNTIRTGSQAGPQAGLFVFDDPAFKTVVCNVVHQAIANSEATVSKLAKQYLQSYSPDTNKLCERIQADLKDETETVLSSTEDATKLKISPQHALFGGLVSAVGGFLKHPLVKEIASEVASRVVKAAVGLLSQSAINDVANGITPNSITLPKQLLASMTANVEDAFDTAAAKLDTRPTASRAQNPVAVPNIFHALQKSIKSTTDSNAVKNILNDLATSIAPELIKQASVRPIDDVLRQAFVQSLTANTTIDGLASDLVKKYPKEMQDLKIQTVVSIALKDAAKEPLKALARGEMAVATPNGMQDQLKANIKRFLQGKASPSSGIKPRPTPIPSDNPLSFVAEDVLQLLNTPSKRAAAATLLSLCTRRASADISMAAGVTKDLSVTYIDAVLAQYEGLHAFLAGTVSSEPSHSLSEEPQHDILSSVLSGAADILTDAKMRSAISNLVHTAIDIAGAKILELFKEARPVKAEQLRTILSENVENVSSNLSKPGSIFQDVDPSVQSGIFDWVKKTVSTVVNNPVVRQVAGAVIDVVSEVGPIVVPLLLAQNPDAEAQDVAKELQRSVTIAMTQAGAAKRVKQSK